MRQYILTLVVLIATNLLTFSQNKVAINIGYGYYLINSENSNKVLGDKRFRSYFHFGFAYQRDNLFGHNLMFEYSYNQLNKEDALVFVRTGLGGPEPIGYIGADVSLINHNLDFDYLGNISEYFRYGFGPSFVITNRIVDIEPIYDKLASSGIGVNGFIEFLIPFTENENHFFFISKVKIRYTHSIWFDEGLRKLDDYSQDFLTSELSVGIGYAF